MLKAYWFLPLHIYYSDSLHHKTITKVKIDYHIPFDLQCIGLNKQGHFSTWLQLSCEEANAAAYGLHS